MKQFIIPPASLQLPAKYQRGYLFGELPFDDFMKMRRGLAAMICNHEKNMPWVRKSMRAPEWQFWATPLRRYTEDTIGNLPKDSRIMNFESYLNQFTDKKLADGGKMALLDIGIGGGWQWDKYLSTYEAKGVVFKATHMTFEYFDERYGKYTIITPADALHVHFGQGTFDFVSSHYSTYIFENQALENIVWILKSGGEAIVSSVGQMPDLRSPADYGKYYDIIHEEKLHDGVHSWVYWIRKK
jgi:SAM-dependent methyltransferase